MLILNVLFFLPSDMSHQNMSDHIFIYFLKCLDTGSQQTCLLMMCNDARKL